MHVTINGEPREVHEGATLGALLAQLGIAPENLAVEHNGEILSALDAERPVADGDRLEIVRFVGGG